MISLGARKLIWTPCYRKKKKENKKRNGENLGETDIVELPLMFVIENSQIC